MLTAEQLIFIQNMLFKNANENIYAIVDGAACPDLRFKIYDWQPVYACLWSGVLEPDLEEVAPYMVKLEKGNAFTEWLMSNGHQSNWNIFVESSLNPLAFRKQIRKLNLVRSPDGKNMVFRFYDPRVLKSFVQMLTDEQFEVFYKGISQFFIVEDANLVTLNLKQSDDELC